MNSPSVQEQISSYSPDLAEASPRAEQVVCEKEARFERLNCVGALCTLLQSQDLKKGGSPRLRIEERIVGC